MSDKNMRLRFIQGGKVLILDRVSLEMSPEEVQAALGETLEGVAVFVFAKEVDVPEADRDYGLQYPPTIALPVPIPVPLPVDERADFEGRIRNLEGLLKDQRVAWDAERADNDQRSTGAAVLVVSELADRFEATNRPHMAEYLGSVADAMTTGSPWPELAVKPPQHLLSQSFAASAATQKMTADAFAAGVRAGLTRASDMTRSGGKIRTSAWLNDCVVAGMDAPWPPPPVMRVPEDMRDRLAQAIDDVTMDGASDPARALREAAQALLGALDDTGHAVAAGAELVVTEIQADGTEEPVDRGTLKRDGVAWRLVLATDSHGNAHSGILTPNEERLADNRSTLTESEVRALTGDTVPVRDTFVVGSADDEPPAGLEYNVLIDVDPANRPLQWLVRVVDGRDREHDYQSARYIWFSGVTQYMAWQTSKDPRPIGDSWIDLVRTTEGSPSFVVRLPTTEERAEWTAS